MDDTTSNCVYLDRGDNVQCTISLFGANIISWVVFGVEQLFASRRTIFDNLKAIKGGIMLIFPHYRYWSLGPADGFANLMTWKIFEGPMKLPTGDIQVVLELEQGQVSNNIWNFVYTIKYTITLLERDLHLEFHIINLSPYSFYFHFLFSNHIRVPDLSKCRITGLKDCKYIDKITDEYLQKSTEEEVRIDKEYFRIFVDTKNQIKVANVMMDRDFFLKKTNLPDTILHSPWEEKAKIREDFSPDEWDKMLILEVGHKYVPVRIYQNETFEAAMKLRVKSDKEEDDIVIQFY